MKPAIIEDKIFEFEPFEEDGSVLMVAETSWRGMADELQESIGQTNSVLLNIVCDYNVRNLTLEIRRYFESTTDAFEVLIFTGRKEISIKRNIATSKGFLKMLMKSFRK